MNTDRFKFRVWSIYEKCYKPDADFWLHPRGVLYKDDGYYRPTDLEDDGLYNHPIDTLSNYIVEQCTGLKDANGELIYVGDIVEGEEDVFEVVPQKYGFAFKDYKGWYYYELLKHENVAIVGNIHENPELLEGEK